MLLCPGASTTISLALDSVAPPAGPPAPPAWARDGAVGAAESRTHAASGRVRVARASPTFTEDARARSTDRSEHRCESPEERPDAAGPRCVVWREA